MTSVRQNSILARSKAKIRNWKIISCIFIHMYLTLFTDKKLGKIIFGPEVEWTAFSGTATLKTSTNILDDTFNDKNQVLLSKNYLSMLIGGKSAGFVHWYLHGEARGSDVMLSYPPVI